MKRIKTFTGKTFNLETFELFFHTQLFSVYFCAYTVDIPRQKPPGERVYLMYEWISRSWSNTIKHERVKHILNNFWAQEND